MSNIQDRINALRQNKKTQIQETATQPSPGSVPKATTFPKPMESGRQQNPVTFQDSVKPKVTVSPELSHRLYTARTGSRISGLQSQVKALEKQEQEARKTSVAAATQQGRGGINSFSGEKTNEGKAVEQISSKRSQVEAQIKALQDEMEKANKAERGRQYSALREAPDFGLMSQYTSTENGGYDRKILPGGTALVENNGFDDILYDYINRNETAISRQDLMDLQSYASLTGTDQGLLKGMRDDEIATFNYIYAKEGKDKAYEYIQFLTEELNLRQRMGAEEYWAQYGKEHPAASSLFSIMTSPAKGLSYLGQAADYLEDGKIDQHAGYNRFSYIPSAIRGQVSRDIEEKVEGFWGKAGSFAYQTGMSMGDFLLNAGITGGNQALSLAIMGTGAAADATISAKDRGLSDDQAFALGTIAGAAEIVTEKVSLETLLNNTTLGRNAVGYILQNVLAEGSEEVASSLINLLADVIIAKDQSEWRQSINAYMEEGYSESEATGLAVKDQAISMGLDFLGGALSGGIMAGGGVAVNSAYNELNARRTGADFRAMGDDVVQATIQEGLASDPSTESYRMARQLQEKLERGESLSDRELGRLYQANVQAVAGEDGAASLLSEATRKAREIGQISNNMAADILENPNAVGILEQQAELAITEDMSKAQRRAAIKEAVSTLSRVEMGDFAQWRYGDTTATQEAAEGRKNAIETLSRTLDSFGQNGQKALLEAYQADQDYAGYYAGFANYYDAGVAGLDMDKVESRYAEQLTPAQKFAAYNSGQNDADASLAEQRRKAPMAATAGVESGLDSQSYTYAMEHYGQEKVNRINAVSAALGTRVGIVESLGVNSNANGQITGDTILLSQDMTSPEMFVIGHEWTHRVQELAPEAYRDFRESAKDILAPRAEKILDIYQRHDLPITYEQAMDEAAADYAGELLEDGKLLDEFIDRNRKDKTLLEKFLEVIRGIIDKLTGREKKQAQTAEQKLAAALDAAAAQAKELDGKSSSQIGPVDDIMAEARNSIKEDTVYGEEREETRSAFTRRAAGEGLTVVGGRGRASVYGSRNIRVQRASAAGAIQEGVKRLGIPAFAMDGRLWQNQDGRSRLIVVSDAAAIPGVGIFINVKTSVPSMEIVGHEAYHFWDGTEARETYTEILRDNLDFSSEAFRKYVETFDGSYFDGDVDIYNKVEMKLLQEELFAYISGDLNEGTRDAQLAPMFRDFEAVKAAWETLVEKQTQAAATPENGLSDRTPRSASGDSISQDGGDINTKFSLKDYTAEEKKVHAKEAIDYFGRTFSWNETGYLTQDGKKIDFSGRHDGAPGGYRTVDHREIRDALGLDYGGDDYSGAMTQFMAEGNIRIMPESNGINLSVLPTKAQEEALDDFISRARGEVTLDIDTPGGDTIVSVEYPKGTRASKVLNDIRQYFDDGTKPYVSEMSKFRYSLKGTEMAGELAALEKENERLRERVEYWRGQLRQTDPRSRPVRQEDLDRVARALAKQYGGMKAEEISKELKLAADLLVQDSAGNLEFDTVKGLVYPLAQRLVQNATVKNDAMYQQYSDLRKYLRETKINVPRNLWSELDEVGGYDAFRKRNMGRLNLSSASGLGVDVAFHELAEQYPEWFNEAQTAHPADQLILMADVLDGLQPVYENPYTGWMDVAVEQVGNEIVDTLLSEELRQVPPTFADRQAEKLEAELARRRDAEKVRLQKAMDRVRQSRDRQVRQLREHYAEMRQLQSDKRTESKVRARLLNIAKRLQNKKMPAVSRELLNQYIGDLDTVAVSMTGASLERLSALQAWYNTQKLTDPNFIADKEIEDRLARLSQRRIADMTKEEVLDLTAVLLNIENELRTKNKLINDGDRRDIYHMGQETINNIYNSPGSKGGFLDKYIVTETLSPVRQIRRMTGYVDNDPMYHLVNALADGQRAMLDYQMKAERPFQKFAADKAFNRDFSGANARAIEIIGETKDGMTTVKITPAMRASLYLHSLNDQNLRHIRDGGITVPDPDLYRKGKIAEAYSRGTTIKMTPAMVRSVTAGMTAQEKAFAQEVSRYFNSTSRDAINAVSEKLKGYPIAQVENYFPINTDTSFTKADFDALKFDGTIQGMGFLKERQIKAANPIMLRDINSVLEQSIQQHGKYVGLAIPVRNFNKVWGVTTSSFNDDGSRNSYESSVQQAVKQQWGEAGYNYVEKLMTDLQSGRPGKNAWIKALNKIRSNYAGAVLTLNASVAMKQAASYPTAAAVLGWRPLAWAMADNGKVDLALIEKYTPLQWYRSKGFSTRELGDMASAKDSKIPALDWIRGKNLPKVLNWVQGVDVLTTRKLWKASEYYVQQNNKALNKGTDAYYREVAEIYNRVIEETQPNYTTMQRPQLLRSDDSLMGNLAMFKTQPFQNFNILYDAAENLIAKKRQGKYGLAPGVLQEAKRNFRRAVSSQLAQLAVFAAMTMVWSMFRGRTDKYEDDEGEMSLESTLAALGKDMVGGAMAGVPFGSDAWELLSSKLFGDSYYGMDAVTITAISDTISSLSGVSELIGETVQSVASGQEINWNQVRIKMDNYTDDISKALGVPYENIANLINATYRQVCIQANGKYVGEYQALKLTTDPEKYSADYYDLLFKAFQNDRTAYETIYEDMVSSGDFSTEKVRNAMESRMKKEQGVTSSGDLERRYLTPEQEKVYDGILEQISGSRVWRSAGAEQREKLEDSLYDLTVSNKAGEKLQEKIDGGAAFGLDETDYLLYQLALSMVDQPTESGKMGTYTNDEVEEAIRMLTGLSDDARGYLWEAQGKSEKSNPWG